MFPSYSVSATDGGFYVRVTVKGVGFLHSCESDLHSSPSEAQESAAFQMITDYGGPLVYGYHTTNSIVL